MGKRILWSTSLCLTTLTEAKNQERAKSSIRGSSTFRSFAKCRNKPSKLCRQTMRSQTQPVMLRWRFNQLRTDKTLTKLNRKQSTLTASWCIQTPLFAVWHREVIIRWIKSTWTSLSKQNGWRFPLFRVLFSVVMTLQRYSVKTSTSTKSTARKSISTWGSWSKLARVKTVWRDTKLPLSSALGWSTGWLKC